MGMSRTPAGRSKPGWRCVQSSFPPGNQRIRSPADCHPLVSGLSSARQRTVLRSSADCPPLVSGSVHLGECESVLCQCQRVSDVRISDFRQTGCQSVCVRDTCGCERKLRRCVMSGANVRMCQVCHCVRMFQVVRAVLSENRTNASDCISRWNVYEYMRNAPTPVLVYYGSGDV